MTKRVRRRVSFSIPEEQETKEKDEVQPLTGYKITVKDDSDIDDIVETKDVNSSDDSDTNSDVIGIPSPGGKVEDLQNGKKSANFHQSKRLKLKAERGREEPPEGQHSNKKRISDETPLSDNDDSIREASKIDEAPLDISEGEESSSSSSDSDADEEGDSTESTETPQAASTFGEMTLDPRVERAIERIGWRRPTPVQSAVVPAALSGRDLLVCAPTGSGKTAAYGIPIAQHLCRRGSEKKGVRVVVFVPTRDLIQQVASVLKLLCRYIDGIRIASLSEKKRSSNRSHASKPKRRRVDSSQGDKDASKAFDSTADIIVGTPAAIAALPDVHGDSTLNNVELVIVDEADLVLSYGHEQDARKALALVPTSSQALLLSATLSADGMDGFRKVVLRRPLTLKITADADIEDGDPTGVSHYFAKLKSSRDRFLVTYAMLRLNVLCGKVLIFVNHITAAFRLKLFLDQFKVKTAVLNSELPANSRVHCVEQFNAGIFDVLIATDEVQRDEYIVVKEDDKRKSSKLLRREKQEKRRRKKDGEFGVSRGVDFREVAAVLNFDVPETLTTYTHRAGRTARGGVSGTVLTLVTTPAEQDEIVRHGNELGVQVGPLSFRMNQIEAFRYRVEDCLRMVTDAAVNAARLADVRREIVNSDKLQDYFEDNPQDLDALKHDLALAKYVPEHLAHIPSYLLPPALRGNVSQEPDGSRFRIRRKSTNIRNVKKHEKSGGADPLKTLSVRKDRSGTSRQRFKSRHKGKQRGRNRNH